EGVRAVPADREAPGLLEGQQLPEAYLALPGAGDGKAGFRKLALLRPENGRRVLVVGLGKPSELNAERLRVAAALSVAEAGRYEARTITWALPDAPGAVATPPELVTGLVEGAILASFRFDRFKSRDAGDPPPP